MTPMSILLPAILPLCWFRYSNQQISFWLQVLTSMTCNGTLFVKHCDMITAVSRDRSWTAPPPQQVPGPIRSGSDERCAGSTGHHQGLRSRERAVRRQLRGEGG